MSRTGFRHLAIAATSLLALAACENTGPLAQQGTPARAAGPQAETTLRMVERDVEAPEVFQADDAGLWDGRPSLGGVWVAHPDVGDPERVIIRNEANGKFVIGALFRRERQNPGPIIQVSSDAAASLGMLAGAPTVLNVTALRRVEEPDAAAAVVQPSPVQSRPTEPETQQVATTPAPQALAQVAPAAPQTPQPAAAPQAEPAISLADLPRSRPGVPAEPVVSLGGRRPASPAMSPDVIAAALGTGSGAAATGGTANAASATPSPRSAPVRASAPARSAPVTSAAAIDRPFVQIGIFAVKDNATRTTQRMQAAGLNANMLEERSQGQTFWRVTVGPATSGAERARVLANVKGMGFTDAYAVSR
jgi:cell division protein FtsN